MLTTVGVEGRVARAQRGSRVVDGEFHEWHELWPVVTAVSGKGAQDVDDDAINTLDLARGGVLVLQAQDEGGAIQKELVKRVSETCRAGVGQARVTEH